MKFIETELAGAWLIELEPAVDERGFFARSWCQREFAEHGLDSQLVQCNISYNARRGTLRGMHYQAAPHGETKLVRVTRGAIYDVLLDVRADSPTFGRWVGVTLSAENRRQLWIPAGFAHGFVVTSDSAEFLYKTTDYWAPQYERCIAWNDPAVGIEWPFEGEPVMSAKDKEGKLLKDAEVFA